MRFIKLVMAALLWTASTTTAVQALEVEEVSAYLAPHYFQWEEFHGGEKLLREQGWLVGAGGLARMNLLKAEAGSLILSGKAELFGGVVDYDGQTQSINETGEAVEPLPVTTKVDYLGTREEVDLGWRILQQKIWLEPFFGLGIRWWLRNLQDSTAIDNTGAQVQVSGYTENWLSGYTRLGARLGYTMTDDWRIFGEGGVKYPFYTANMVETSDSDITLKPDGRWSAFAEIGARYRQVKVSTFYEGFRYGQSPAERSGSFSYIQPTSESDVFGLRMGWAFR